MHKGKHSYISFDGTWLGDVKFTPVLFDNHIYNKLIDRKLLKMSSFEKHHFVGSCLLEEIKAAPSGGFIFPAIVDFIHAVREDLLPTYTFYSFEIFLDNYAGLNEKESLFIRGKIVGRYIPRSEYQAFFPIGLGGTFKGSHFSVAHFSPDVDTVIASFHGFLDAFAARIGDGIHYWQVPAGPPSENIEIDNLFFKALGRGVFDVCVNTAREISVNSMDLVSQRNMTTLKVTDRSIGIAHGRSDNSVVVTLENGDYYADWRAIDFDEVRLIINQFGMILKTFEKSLYMVAVQCLLKKASFHKNVTALLANAFAKFLDEKASDPYLLEKQRAFITKVLNLDKGLDATIGSFLSSTETFAELYSVMNGLDESSDIENVLKVVHEALSQYFEYLDTLDVAIAVKRKVLNIAPMTLSHLDSFETILEKMEGFSHLTVVHADINHQTPLGVIHAKDLKNSGLATVSIRDFSNGDEMDKPPYIDIISCIDHHKSELKTCKPARMIVSDAQSSNSIIARMNLEINRKYSTGGLSKEQINAQIEGIRGDLNDPVSMRIMQKLLSKKEVFSVRGMHYISIDKEFLDYYHFLFAILDDTDLLTKVTAYDVYVVCDLLNSMKSIQAKKEVEIVNFDNLDKDDASFAYNAARKLLQTHDLYSLYNANHDVKEKKLDEMLKKATSTLEKPFFQDTKILGKYAQIGQFKMFFSNHATFQRKRADIQKHWLRRCKVAASSNSDLSIFVFMVSTVDSAGDLFTGDVTKHAKINDEVWVTCLEDNRASLERMKRFLTSLMRSPKVYPQNLKVNLHGSCSSLKEALKKISKRISIKVTEKEKLSVAELFIESKSLKSRKTDIAPYL